MNHYEFYNIVILSKSDSEKRISMRCSLSIEQMKSNVLVQYLQFGYYNKILYNSHKKDQSYDGHQPSFNKKLLADVEA